jgi:hypothetical protein
LGLVGIPIGWWRRPVDEQPHEVNEALSVCGRLLAGKLGSEAFLPKSLKLVDCLWWQWGHSCRELTPIFTVTLVSLPAVNRRDDFSSEAILQDAD